MPICLFLGSLLHGFVMFLKSLSVVVLLTSTLVASGDRNFAIDSTLAKSEQAAIYGSGGLYDMDCEVQTFGGCVAAGGKPGLINCGGVALGASCGQPKWCPGTQTSKACTKISWWGIDCSMVLPAPSCNQSDTVCGLTGTCNGVSTAGNAGCGTHTNCVN